MTMMQIDNAQDVVGFLKAQHEQIKAMFERVNASSGEDREEAFVALRRLLAVHETAEEEIVHPRARRDLADGEDVVRARLDEEHEAKVSLGALEKLDADSTDFESKFRSLQADVLKHAQAEEQTEFPQLRTQLDEHELERMRRAVEMAEKMAPTRPHAGVESASKNMLAGPFAMMMDRARDAMSGKG